MAAKKKSVLAQRATELEDAVARLFTGEGPAPKSTKRKAAGRKAARTRKVKSAKKAVTKAAGAAKRSVKARTAKRKGKKSRR